MSCLGKVQRYWHLRFDMIRGVLQKYIHSGRACRRASHVTSTLQRHPSASRRIEFSVRHPLEILSDTQQTRSSIPLFENRLRLDRKVRW
jgi:hypothetical protein